MCVFVEAEDVQHETLANICHLIFSVQKKNYSSAKCSEFLNIVTQYIIF